MRSTMMDFPLTIRHIFEHGRALYSDSEVVTCEADGARHIEFGALADRAEQLAAALRRLGIAPVTGWPPSGGTTRNTRRRTSPSPAWAR